ncbi:hypothetical protein Hanom_Chr16g01468011 [Helianthus anomalus]
MVEEFYNMFYTVYTSETTNNPIPVSTKTVSSAISENLKNDTLYGDHQGTPKLMNTEDYHWLSTRFENWVKAYANES